MKKIRSDLDKLDDLLLEFFRAAYSAGSENRIMSEEEITGLVRPIRRQMAAAIKSSVDNFMIYLARRELN